jgi:hypothetical protein
VVITHLIRQIPPLGLCLGDLNKRIGRFYSSRMVSASVEQRMLNGSDSTADIQQGETLDALLLDGLKQHLGGLLRPLFEVALEVLVHYLLAEEFLHRLALATIHVLPPY